MRRWESGRECLLRVVRMSRGRSSGQTMIVFALFGLILIGFLALAVDGGFILAERRQVQSAADAAALAAAKAVLDQRTAAVVNASGQSYGTINSEPDSTVVINWPPLTGPYAGDLDYVEAIVTQPVRQFFVGAVYDGDWSVTARAVAGIRQIVKPYALLALRDCANGGSGIYINGSGTVNVHQGSIMSNCNITRSGQSSVVSAGGTIDANGTINPGSLWHAGEGYHWRPVVPDPITQNNIPAPSRAAAQDVRSVTTTAELQAAVTNLAANGSCSNNATCVMLPGYYGGNLNINVQGTLEMQPGIYYFGDGFSLTTTSSNAIIRGLNVLLYVTDNAAFVPANAYINLTAAATSLYSGGLDGMVLWIENCTPFQMQSNGRFTLEGVLYAPCSQVRLYGSPGSNGVQIIVGNLELSGGGSFDLLFTEYISANSPAVFLIE